MSENQEERGWLEESVSEVEHIVGRVKDLIDEMNAHHIRVKTKDGRYHVEVPLTAGVLAGGAFVLASPLSAALGALTALVTDVKVDVIRERDEEPGGENVGDDTE